MVTNLYYFRVFDLMAAAVLVRCTSGASKANRLYVHGRWCSCNVVKPIAQVFAWANSFLDEAVPLANGANWSSVTSMGVKDGQLDLGGASLQNPAQFVGYTDKTVLLKNNGLHIELKYGKGSKRASEQVSGIGLLRRSGQWLKLWSSDVPCVGLTRLTEAERSLHRYLFSGWTIARPSASCTTRGSATSRSRRRCRPSWTVKTQSLLWTPRTSSRSIRFAMINVSAAFARGSGDASLIFT